MAQLSIKAYYVENKSTKEIRKFSVDADVSENFEYLVGKIRQVFPDLLRKDLELFWKDDEGDYISMSTDEEIQQALNAIPPSGDCLKIYVKVKSSTLEESSVEHPGITCDGCESKIQGIRYKCTSCFDFDLCASCESKGQHPEDHELLCIRKPRSKNVYVMRSPFGRGCHRGRGAWGPWGMRRGGGRHCHKGAHCKNSKNENETENEKEDPQEPKHPFNDIIAQLAASFGLDPDVARSQAQSFSANCSGEDVEKFNEFLPQFAHSFGLDPEHLKETASMFFSQTQEKKPEESKESKSANLNDDEDGEITITKKEPEDHQKSEEKMETDASSTKKDEASPEAPIPQQQQEQQAKYDEMVNKLAEQFGFKTQEVENSPFGGLSEVMGKVFESFSSPATKPKSLEETSETKEVKKEDFEIVDSTPLTETLTEEQKYEQRLEKAIKQMEAMGFDNDGGWLKQLLITKELSIGKVLDALNPSI